MILTPISVGNLTEEGGNLREGGGSTFQPDTSQRFRFRKLRYRIWPESKTLRYSTENLRYATYVGISVSLSYNSLQREACSPAVHFNMSLIRAQRIVEYLSICICLKGCGCERKRK